MKSSEAHTIQWVRLYAIGAVLLAALIAGWAISSSILSSPDLLIQDVEVQGLQYLTQDDVLQIADLDQPKSTLKVQNEDVIARLHASPWIRAVTLERPRRETLRIVIEEATPRVIVAAPALMLADASGTIIDHLVAMYEDLPLLTGATRTIDDDGTPEYPPIDHRLLALSRGLGGTPIERELDTAIDVAIVRDAVRILDAWKDLPQTRRWPIDELGWDAAEGFTLWMAKRVEVKLGHRDFESALQRTHAALHAAQDAPRALTRVDVRSPSRAVVRFDVQASEEGAP